MRAAIYNRYWPTLGGGELFAASIARALTDRGMDVDLVGFEPLRIDAMSERLGVDLGGVESVVVDTEHAASVASGWYDLFVNATYLSSATNLAPRGVFVVHFPGSRLPLSGTVRQRFDATRRKATHRPWLRWLDGLYRPEGNGSTAWTNGLARLLVWLPAEGAVSFTLSSRHWPPGHRVEAIVKCGTEIAFRGVVEPGSPAVVVVRPPLSAGPALVVIGSDSFLPALTFGTVDGRQLGLQIGDLRVNGRPHRIGPSVRSAVPGQPHLDTYDVIAANSGYTARWVAELWGRDCQVLYPPVAARRAGVKERMILAVGRFFDPRRGHSKKQVELVRAFRALAQRGVHGWSLHLVGGCSPEDREYAMAVKREAVGLPVSVYLNASKPRLDDLYARSALFWHAAGYDENVRRTPDRFEHFGISVAEAVTAGCIPLVFAHGGPSEIIAPVPNARVWHTLDELVETTAQLAAAFDEGRLSGRAGLPEGSRLWGDFDHFSRRLTELLPDSSNTDAFARGAQCS